MKAILIITALLCAAPSAQAYCDADKVGKSFGKTYKSTMKAIKARDAAGLLNVFNRSGVRFGTQTEAVPYAEIERQFSQQGKAYCDVFVCEDRPGFISRITGAGISATQETNYWLGKATGVARVSNGSVAGKLELHFSTTASCDWQLDALIFNE
jgi:hypothetical protein